MHHKPLYSIFFCYILVLLSALIFINHFDPDFVSWFTHDKQQVQVLIDNKVVYSGARDGVISYIEGKKIRVDVYDSPAQLFVTHSFWGGGNGNVVERTL